MILGVEWFDELELTAKGVTFTVDNMDITSTERVPPAADVSSSVEGSGLHDRTLFRAPDRVWGHTRCVVWDRLQQHGYEEQHHNRVS